MDVLPAGLSYQTSLPFKGSYNPEAGLWDIGILNAGESASLQIDATANSVEQIVNTARITNADRTDPDSTNNGASVIVNQDLLAHLSSVDLAVQKTVNRVGVDVGGDAIFTILVRNNGPDGASNVVLEDILPNGMDFVSSDPSQGTYSHQTGMAG